MYENYCEDICESLSTITGVKSITRGWPASFDRLPCLAIAEAGNAPDSIYDDLEYTSEVEYYVRIFSKSSQTNDAIAAEVDAHMVEDGYIRTFAYEDDNPDVRQKIMRYSKVV